MAGLRLLRVNGYFMPSCHSVSLKLVSLNCYQLFFFSFSWVSFTYIYEPPIMLHPMLPSSTHEYKKMYKIFSYLRKHNHLRNNAKISGSLNCLTAGYNGNVLAFHKYSNIIFGFLALAPVAFEKHHLINSQCSTKVTIYWLSLKSTGIG